MPRPSNSANFLRGWIYSYFGGFQQLAQRLDLSTSTISDWTTQNPRNMLKYIPEITELAQVEPTELIEAVQRREAEMNA